MASLTRAWTLLLKRPCRRRFPRLGRPTRGGDEPDPPVLRRRPCPSPRRCHQGRLPRSGGWSAPSTRAAPRPAAAGPGHPSRAGVTGLTSAVAAARLGDTARRDDGCPARPKRCPNPRNFNRDRGPVRGPAVSTPGATTCCTNVARGALRAPPESNSGPSPQGPARSLAPPPRRDTGPLGPADAGSLSVSSDPGKTDAHGAGKKRPTADSLRSQATKASIRYGGRPS